MRTLSIVIFLMSAGINNAAWMGSTVNNKPLIKFQVVGTILQTVSYCGGAKPTQKILDSCNTPRAIPYGKLFIREGFEKKDRITIMDSMVADANGKFSIYLPPGNYCLVEEWKSKPINFQLNNRYQKIDSSCFRNLYYACDYKFTITNKSINILKIIFHRNCFFSQPCISYRGPLPHKVT